MLCFGPVWFELVVLVCVVAFLYVCARLFVYAVVCVCTFVLVYDCMCV